MALAWGKLMCGIPIPQVAPILMKMWPYPSLKNNEVNFLKPFIEFHETPINFIVSIKHLFNCLQKGPVKCTDVT
jgi:hypothetical protein